MTNYFQEKDTIAAIATPAGVGGISIVRISGEHACSTALKIADISQVKPRFAHFAKIIDPTTNIIVDEVLITYFKAPASYTGDDTVEISCHGGYTAAPAVLDLCYNAGARPALPGEFTRRAFLNGKLDLIQAEAVGDLIHSRSTSAHLVASRALQGKLSEKITHMKSTLLDIAAILELELDFVEQEINTVPRSQHLDSLNKAQKQLTSLIDSYKQGKIQREGVLVPIVGKPNAGKSSLLNALLQEDRAIISHIPGTTRDTIEESFEFQGLLYRLVDTAGLRDSQDPIEVLGTERARQLLAKADMIIMVSDINNRDTDFENYINSSYSETPILHVLNKIDLLPSVSDHLETDSIAISAKTQEGIEKLKTVLADKSRTAFQLSSDSIAVSKQRHLLSLKSARDAINTAISACSDDLSNEFIAMDVREAIHFLDDITGETTSEDVLNRIFQQFCIGK